MSKCYTGQESRRHNQAAKNAAVKRGDPCRMTTYRGQPFTDVDTALVNAGLKKVR